MAETGTPLCEPQRKRRIPEDGRKKWTDAENLQILEYLHGTVISGEKIETPTALTYYTQMKDKLGFVNSETPVSVSLLRNKVRNMKTIYSNALKWIQTTGREILETEGLLAYNEARDKRYPNFSLMDAIFGNKEAMQSICFNETNGSQVTVPEGSSVNEHVYNEDYPIDYSGALVEAILNEEHSGNGDHALRALNYKNSGTSPLSAHLPSAGNSGQLCGSEKPSGAFGTVLMSLMSERAEWKLKELELEEKKLEETLKLEKQRLELSRTRFEREHELNQARINLEEKKMEIHKELELKKIEKDAEVEKFRIEQEYKFKMFMQTAGTSNK